MKPVVVLVLLFLVLAGGALFIGHLVFEAAWGDEYDLFESVQVGMAQEEVREKLGEPYKVYEAQTAPEDYYVEGWAYKRRPITNKVEIYIATEPIAYVWYDDENRVEEVFVGGS